MGKLEGKIALITGGNSGIGLATAKHFVNEGAYVFITGRRDPELVATVKEIGRNVTGVQGDVSNLGDLDRLFAQIKREKGKLDIVFANAGVARFAPFGTITEEFYDSIFNINVKGLLFTVQKALPLMPDGASIILNASIVASKGLPANSVYSATKAAVRSFARTWTTDLKERRIRVNAVSPGSIDTPGLSDLLASTETGQQSPATTKVANVRIQKCEPCQILGRRRPQGNPIDATFHTVCLNYAYRRGFLFFMRKCGMPASINSSP
jgi:NAD(P)-dependent dehydrogenase (short-subunit alcohol dehydrogenase family)